MTKYARLPDGGSLGFGDEVDDNEMHRQVREHMRSKGMQVPPTREEMMRDEDVQMSGGRNQAIAALGQQIQQLSQVVYKLCEDQKITQRMLAQVGMAIGKLDQTVGSAAQQIGSALMAPVTQTVQRDAEGRIETTTITRGNG